MDSWEDNLKEIHTWTHHSQTIQTQRGQKILKVAKEEASRMVRRNQSLLPCWRSVAQHCITETSTLSRSSPPTTSA